MDFKTGGTFEMVLKIKIKWGNTVPPLYENAYSTMNNPEFNLLAMLQITICQFCRGSETRNNDSLRFTELNDGKLKFQENFKNKLTSEWALITNHEAIDSEKCSQPNHREINCCTYNSRKDLQCLSCSIKRMVDKS